jgi:hypothetical protein
VSGYLRRLAAQATGVAPKIHSVARLGFYGRTVERAAGGDELSLEVDADAQSLPPTPSFDENGGAARLQEQSAPRRQEESRADAPRPTSGSLSEWPARAVDLDAPRVESTSPSTLPRASSPAFVSSPAREEPPPPFAEDLPPPLAVRHAHESRPAPFTRHRGADIAPPIAAREETRVRPMPAPAPDVHIHIGRVELSAIVSPEPRSETAPAAQKPMSLDEYLRRERRRTP